MNSPRHQKETMDFACPRAALLWLLLLVGTMMEARPHSQTADLLHRVASYPSMACPTPPDSFVTYSYAKVLIDVEKRNLTLAAVPTLFYLMRDNRRHFLSESYVRIAHHRDGKEAIAPLLYLSTTYNNHRTLPNLRTYLLPTPYRPTLFAGHILSPLCPDNRRYYRYRMQKDRDGRARLSFQSRNRNTQLLRRGWATIEASTGRVEKFRFEGEYDMVKFTVEGEMGVAGIPSLFPKSCRLEGTFRFLGNRLRAHVVTFPQLPPLISAQAKDNDAALLMERIRPVGLDSLERRLADTYQHATPDATANDSTPKRRSSWAKRVLWDMIGDNILNRISARFGSDKQGYVRFSPLFNPLYMGYSGRRGLYYKFKAQANYRFNDNQELSTTIRLGYSFKQKQLFFNLPVTWRFNKRRNGFVFMQFSNGNRITDSRALEAIKNTTTRDTIQWDSLGLDYFRDSRLQVSAGIDLVPSRLGFEAGVVFHRRSAVDSHGFDLSHRPSTYRTFGPFAKFIWRPLSDRVPLAFSMRYDQGTGWLSSNLHYARMELDGQYIRHLSRMRSLSLRAGGGFYFDKVGDTYFVDYQNFQEEYVPGGWNDDWTGEFEVLNSHWYNASNFYARANATYESPMLLLARFPLLGRIVETERIHLGALAVSHYVPYVELGYSFTNRVFSFGIFTGMAPHHFEGVELKFGLELFSNW